MDAFFHFLYLCTVMRSLVYFFIFLGSFLISFSQEQGLDSKYLEDQFYLGVSYNSFENEPSTFSQNKFPFSINLGFVRDIPLNDQRNFGVGIGVGYGFNSYFGNNRIVANKNIFELRTLSTENDYTKNQWITHSVELPFQIRWRTSTSDLYKFWRIYSGIKASYVFSSQSIYRSNTQKKTLHSLPMSPIQLGLTADVGHSTWNLSLYYGLSSFFEKKSLPNNPNFHNVNELKIGLIFYVF